MVEQVSRRRLDISNGVCPGLLPELLQPTPMVDVVRSKSTNFVRRDGTAERPLSGQMGNRLLKRDSELPHPELAIQRKTAALEPASLSGDADAFDMANNVTLPLGHPGMGYLARFQVPSLRSRSIKLLTSFGESARRCIRKSVALSWHSSKHAWTMSANNSKTECGRTTTTRFDALSRCNSSQMSSTTASCVEVSGNFLAR